MIVFIQELSTEKKGKIIPFRPSFAKLIYNLKRKQLWKSVEVHAIYAFLYILCTNKVGLQHVQIYFSSTDNQIHDPIFIAQYLLAPVNTIVKKYLLPWMMKVDEKLESTNEHLYRARSIKSELLLKYLLLIELMKIVRKHCRKPDYDFE